MTKVSTCFGLLRHGETVWNRQKRIQGRLDSELTDDGRQTIHRWAQFLASRRWSWDRIAVSPAPRAQKTAAVINELLHLETETLPALREQDWGRWEGLSWFEIEENQDAILQEQVEAGWSFRPPGGESRSEVRDRGRSALADLGRRYAGEDILVICHQGVIKSLVYAIEGRNFRPDEKKLIDKNSLQLLLWTEHGLAAKAYNIVPPEKT